MDILMAKFGETKMIRYFQNRRVVLGVAFAIGIVAVFLFVLFWLNLTRPNRFYRGQLGDNSPFFVFMGQLRGQPREQLLGIWG